MKPSFRLLVLRVLRYLVVRDINAGQARDEAIELVSQLEDAIEEEKKEIE